VNLINGFSTWLIPERVDEAEWLDLGVSQAAMRANLADLWRINRYFGGLRALTDHLYPLLSATKSPQTIVDIGTGSADVPAAVARWAQAQQLDVRIIGLDIAAAHLSIAHERTHDLQNVRLVQADATNLPFAQGEVDYLISSLFFHHLSPEQIIALLRSAFACARLGIIISDLTRGRLPLMGFKLIEPFFSAVTQHDGEVSIRRGYTPAEFATFAQAAGLTNARVHCHFPWRMTLVAQK
jgi:hypothetical protein